MMGNVNRKLEKMFVETVYLKDVCKSTVVPQIEVILEADGDTKECKLPW